MSEIIHYSVTCIEVHYRPTPPTTLSQNFWCYTAISLYPGFVIIVLLQQSEVFFSLYVGYSHNWNYLNFFSKSCLF